MASNSTTILVYFMLLLAAFLYASVGHGGASSYIVLLTLLGFLPDQIKPTALILNIGVSLISFLSFNKESYFPRQLFFSLIIFSIPATFVGSMIHVDIKLYQKILGIILLFPIFRLFNIFKYNQTKVINRKAWMAPLLGLSIGFVSGLIGIGGGIILSPVLLLLGWTDIKQTATISALFIFLNSISGLIGLSFTAFSLPPNFEYMLPMTLLGGILGSYFGAKKFNFTTTKLTLGMVLTIASIKFIFQ